ncbi:MAG: hypothetical protein KatS3mg031_2977 [Chitinophagales bacterium]|nr:MAG: hypothetical protein KatS3mg031_2977 [Chitinophagales bacterium]
MPSNNPNHMDNLNPPWKKGESGNPKGRPRKLFTDMARELKAQGYENVTAPRLIEAYEILLGLPEEKLKEIMTDKDQPVLFKILIKGMISSKGYELIEKMLDRVHGKPRQSIDISADMRESVKKLFPFGKEESIPEGDAE